MSTLDIIKAAESQLSARAGQYARLRQYWRGQQPAAFLSHEAREALDSTLSRLTVNYPRLAVQSLAERIAPDGFTHTDAPDRAAAAWDAFKHGDGAETMALITADRLMYGCAYGIVWADDTGAPVITGSSPASTAVLRSPGSSEPFAAVRIIDTGDGDSSIAAAVYTPDHVELWKRAAAGSWKHSGETMANGLRRVPVVRMLRRESLDDTHGHPYPADILDLSDAISKLLADAMVGSEYFARPRRWVTGLEIEEDAEGNALDPFGTGRLMQSEDPDTRFGQLEAGRLNAYSDMVATLTQQVGALTGLPPHYLGLHGDQPPTAEAVRAAEVQLTTRAYAEQRRMSRGVAEMAWLTDAVLRGEPANPASLRAWDVAWESPETRTMAQAADAAGKLRQLGVPLEAILRDTLGYGPDDARTMADESRVDLLVAGGE